MAVTNIIFFSSISYYILSKKKRKKKVFYTLSHTHILTLSFPFFVHLLWLNWKSLFFIAEKVKIRERIKKKHKRRRWHKQSTTRRHTMNKWTIKQISKHTDRHVCMCAYSLQRPHREKKQCFSKEKLWFWSEYMILMVLFVATELNSPCYFFFLIWLFNCCLLLVLCYCLFALLCFTFLLLFFFLFCSFTRSQNFGSIATV